jgi:hypothetical protein
MLSLDAFTRRSLAVLAACGTLVIASCGGDSDFGLGPRFPVTGTVTYNGKPLEKGQINFIPDDLTKGTGAMAPIENGTFSLSTIGQNDGARPGKYKVTVTAKEDSEAQAKADFEKAKAKFSKLSGGTTENVGRIPREFQNKAARQAKSLVPAGYGDPSTTTLTAEVKESPNTFNFPLTDKDAPPEPSAPGKARGRKGG